MVSPQSLANLKPFKKGDGRKRGKPLPPTERISDLVKALLDKPYGKKPGLTYRQALAQTILEQAISGEASFMNIVLDRLEGKVAQPMQHAGEGGGPIRSTVVQVVSPASRTLTEQVLAGARTDAVPLPAVMAENTNN